MTLIYSLKGKEDYSYPLERDTGMGRVVRDGASFFSAWIKVGFRCGGGDDGMNS